MVKNEPMTEAMYYVLLALLQPCHGYQIMSSVGELSCGRVSMGPGTLYGILNRLEKKKLIELLEEDSRKKVYIITDVGKELLVGEYKRLMAMVKDGQLLEKECL